MSIVEKNFNIASEIYASHGVDVNAALDKLASIPVSLHAWQGDDVTGFESTGHALTGGCQVTGNYPGRAGNADELRSDLDMALGQLPGVNRVCLQGHEVDKMFPGVDRDAFTIDNFSNWLDWAKERKIGMDIAPAFYSHVKLDNGLSLSHPDPEIRKFWINHGKAIRKIGEVFGRELGTASVCNFWAPDGYKDIPADRLSPRERLRDSLDEIFAEKIDPAFELDAVEPKLFGIGTESYTTGSNDFYLTYAASRNKLICFDTGHFHPTESVADKLSSVIALQGKILLHVSRGVRWDSDHVTVLNDELRSVARETVRCGNPENIYICLDYFDASINRIAAWVVGCRNFRKALLIALLEPYKMLKDAENEFDFSKRLALFGAIDTLPWGAVWDYFCEKSGVDPDFCVMDKIRDYEKKVLINR